VSFDLAVWEGDRPANDFAAAAEFKRLYDQYTESGAPVEPTARIAAYVQALLARYPDIDTEAGEESPWSTAPLMDEARGPLVYFPMAWSRSEETSEWATRLAEHQGLNCFDPQATQLRTSYREEWRFELTSARGRPFRDPDADLIRRVVVQLSAENYYATLTRADGWYVQAAHGEPGGRYALERRDGAPDKHFRAELTDINEVVQAFVGFLEDDPTIAVRFPWRPYSV
jgi:hypothetical protein